MRIEPHIRCLCANVNSSAGINSLKGQTDQLHAWSNAEFIDFELEANQKLAELELFNVRKESPLRRPNSRTDVIPKAHRLSIRQIKLAVPPPCLRTTGEISFAAQGY